MVVELPSSGSVGPLGDLVDDVAAVRDALAELDDAVVCSHSYGGVPVTEAAAGHPSVRHLVYAAALMPDDGEFLADLMTRVDTGRQGAAVEFHEDGSYTEAPGGDGDLLAGCAPEAAAWYRANAVRRANSALAFAPPGAVGWRDVPSTYVVATADDVLAADTQRSLAERAGRIVELASGHLLPLERPRELAAILADLARAR